MNAEHAIIAPSANDVMVQCPGSVKAQQTVPELEESQESRDGTASHWVGSSVLIAYKRNTGDIDPYSYIDKTAPNGVIITDEMAEAAELYIMEVLKVAQRCGGLQSMYIEERVDIPQIHDSLSWGTPDCWIYDKANGILYIFDFKYGHRYVEIENNYQLVSYALGVMALVFHNYNGIQDQHINVSMCVVQPRYFRADPVRYWNVKGSDLRAHANIMRAAAENALSDNPTIQSGPKCIDCNARHTCEGAQRAAMAGIDIAYEMSLVEYPAAALATEIEMLERAADAIKFRLSGMQAIALTRIKSGEHIPGLKAQSKLSRQNWNKPAAQVLVLGKMFGIELSKEATITPTQAIAKGIDATVINQYSGRTNGALQLVKSDSELAKKIFGVNKNE